VLPIRESVPLAPYTTIQLGGPARFFAECSTVDHVREALDYARHQRLPVHILGGGSNVVFADQGFAGLVLHVAIGGLGFDDGHVTAGAGVVWDDLVAQSVLLGLSGIECLSGIPGFVGGAPLQNIGAYGQEVADTLVDVDCLDRTTLERVTFTRDDCAFSYRMSRFKARDRDRYVVLGVRLRLAPNVQPTLRYAELIRAVGETATPAAVRDAVLALRRGKSMVLDPGDPNTRSVGSFFMNPVIPEDRFAALQARQAGPIPTFAAPNGIKIPAAWLIEQAGFPKGYRRNGVGLSTHHALALVNRGGTTAELLALAQDIERAVRERFGITLEREAVIVA
jgi:UDP-N-acetylmuramate dehydrogenase